MPQLRDLELLIESKYPVIAVETEEEDRLYDMLRRLTIQINIPLYMWTPVDGLTRPPLRDGSPESREPLPALGQVAASRGDGIYLFKDLHKYMAAKRRIRVELTPEDLRRLAESLRGLTLFEAERALTRAIMEDMALTRADMERIIAVKKEVIEREGLLDFWPRLDDFGTVGGLKNLKAWLERRRRAYTQEARQFGLDPPKGILLLGVQGCGKSLCAKAVAKEWELPLLKMEPGRLYDKFIGESEKNLERALHVAETLAPVVLWIDEIEKGLDRK